MLNVYKYCSILTISTVLSFQCASATELHPPEREIRTTNANENSFTSGPQSRPNRGNSEYRSPEFSNDVIFRPAIEVALPGRQGLGDGRVVDPKFFPANMFSIQVNSACTSTLVGPNAVLTAAHCVDYKDPSDPSRTRPMTIESETMVLKFSCEMHPEYAAGLLLADTPRNSKDVAMCLLDGAVDLNTLNEISNLSKLWDGGEKFFTTMAFENIALRQTISEGDTVLLGGYGCQLKKDNDGYFFDRDPAGRQKFRIGENKISSYRSGKPDRQQGSATLSRFDSVSLVADPWADLCKGDSGGSVFHNMTFDDAEILDFERKIVAVNSGMAFYEDRENNDEPTVLSVFADLTQADVASWIRKWARENDAKICGVTVREGKCRSATTPAARVGSPQSHDHTHTHTITHSHSHTHDD